MIEKLMNLLQSIKDLQVFSPNERLKDVHTERIKLMLLPYHLGWLYGRVREQRMKAVTTSKDFLSSFLGLMDQFDCEDEEIFPKNLRNMRKAQSDEPSYRPPRDELVQALRDCKLVEKRYENWEKIKDAGQRRQALKDFITIQIHEAITMLRSLEEEVGILKYKDSLEKDPEVKQQHESQLAKPIPKMKVWQIPPKEEILNCMCPDTGRPEKGRKETVAQVWQQNANKPTMTLDEAGQLQIDNSIQRSERGQAAGGQQRGHRQRQGRSRQQNEEASPGVGRLERRPRERSRQPQRKVRRR